MIRLKTRTFKIVDIDCESIIEVSPTRKEVFEWMEEYIDNLQYDWFDGSDDSFAILYDDGTEDYINEEYDGHKIRKQHIVSMVYNNACTAIVYGGFAINEYGVVTTSREVVIAAKNIVEIIQKKY